MALSERLFDVFPTGLNFFDRYFRVAAELEQLEKEMGLMRQQMFHLLPHNSFEAAGSMTPAAVVQLQPLAPIIHENGETKLKLEFSVKDFQPNEVKVKILGNNTLQVRAEHEEQTESGETKKRLYVRQYQVPKGVDIEHMKPTLSKDGVLTIEAPAPSLKPSERLVPIQFKGDETPMQQ
jgi:HSP20 family molecular chaperone IbpA